MLEETEPNDEVQEIEEQTTRDLPGSSRALLSEPRKRTATGPSKSSWVWKFFEDGKSGKPVCKVEECGKEVYRSTKTMADHLLNIHEKLRKQFENAKSEADTQKSAKVAGSSAGLEEKTGYKQSTLQEAFSHSRKSDSYGIQHPKQVKVDRDLALLFASTNLPYYFIEKPQFLKPLKDLDSKYVPPHRKKLANMILKETSDLRKTLRSLLEMAEKITICVDLWSRKVTSFAGITAHFWTSKSLKVEHMLLGLARVDYPHTAIRVKLATDTILEEWGIQGVVDSRIYVILTDNGSNVVAAFKDCMELIDIYREEEEELLAQVDPNIEEEGNEDDFDSREEENNRVFNTLVRKKRLSCVDHKLANNLKKGFESNQEASVLLEKVVEIVRKIRSTGKACNYLDSNHGKRLILPVRTRWAFHFYVIDRVLQLEDAIHHICRHLLEDVNDLTTTEWKQLKALREILSPYELYIRKLEGQYYATLSRVIPAIQTIKIRLRNLREELPYFSALIDTLLDDMKRRFRDVFDKNFAGFQVIYAIATYLDPKFSRILNAVDLVPLRDAATNELQELMKAEIQHVGDHEVEIESFVPDSCEGEEFPELMMEVSATVGERSADPEEVNELKLFSEILKSSELRDPFDFWRKHQMKIPHLFKIAVHVLAVPATTAPVERIFSKAGLCEGTKSRRVNLTDENLEREVMLTVNMAYLKDYIYL